MASLIFSTNVSDTDNVVHLDSSAAVITVDDDDTYLNSIGALKDISKLNNLTELCLIVELQNITLHKMNFTNTKIKKLQIETFDLLLNPSFLHGISCMPSLEKLILQYRDTIGRKMKSLKLRIKNYLDNNKNLKQIEIKGYCLHRCTKEELENYCKTNDVLFIYDPTFVKCKWGINTNNNQ